MELFLDQYIWVNLAALIFNNFSVLLNATMVMVGYVREKGPLSLGCLFIGEVYVREPYFISVM